MVKIKQMTERLKSIISVPVWVLTLLIPLFIGLMSFTITLSVKAGQMQEKVNGVEKQLDTKADKKDILYIKEMLLEIRNDVKQHVQETK